MERFELPMQCYNDLWINCKFNNYVGILLTHSESFRALAFTMSKNYSLYQPVAEPVDTIVNEVGTCTLEVLTTLPPTDVNQWFEVKDLVFESTEHAHDLIRQSLHDGYYLFVDLDRFYFPSGVEYMDRTFVHPTFVYGYDEQKQTYLLIEDCVKPRLLAPYELRFDNFDLAFQELAKADKGFYSKTGIRAVKVHTKPNFHYTVTAEKVIGNLQELLTDKSENTSELCIKHRLERHFGLSCIDRFAGQMEELFANVSRGNLPIHYALVSFPYDFQKSNLKLLDCLVEHHLLQPHDADTLRPMYQRLAKQWEMYKNNMSVYLNRRLRQPDYAPGQAFFVPLAELLRSIYVQEREATEAFVEALLEGQGGSIR